MRILVVEDEQGISSFLEDGLREEGFTVDVAADGTTGLQMALTDQYDLLLIDWMLPGITGLDISKKVRANDSVVPIIFVTARDTLEDTIAGLQSGANDYLKKPFHFEELLERIKVQLRPRYTDGRKLSIGDINIDTGRHEVRRGSHAIHLTQKEFDLLAYLVSHKNNVCLRSDIIRDVWDIHFDYDTSVIDVYINSLRKKLRLDVNDDYIRTIRGLGYIAQDNGN